MAGRLEVTEIELFYGDARALDRVSLAVEAGTTVAVVGANGAGKTSLIRTIAGLMVPARGRIRFDGQDITGWSSDRVCALGIGQVAEGRQLFGGLSVRENLEMGALVPRARAHRRASRARVLDLFPRLTERLDQAAGTLSGGEQQMLAIGRCLMSCPRLILLDEPSQGLAPALVGQLYRVIAGLKADGLTLVLVEQTVAASLKIADAAYVLEQGRVVRSGTGAELLADPAVRTAYLGL